MAGAYPDVPGYRFAYDGDGTILSVSNQNGTGPVSILPSGAARNLNKGLGSTRAYAGDGYTSLEHYLTFFFPEVRTITGYYIAHSNNTSVPISSNRTIQTSSNATTPQDGTWTTLLNPYAQDMSVDTSPLYRSNLQTVSWPNVYCLRIRVGRDPQVVHLYGSIATTESPDRLRIVDTSGDDIAAQLDFGDIRQRNNVTKQFRVVNNSSTKTANNITVTFDTNPDASPTLIGQYQLSTDNTAFANAINIGTLGPGASSGTLYLRDTISATAQLGPWSLRLIASANTWS